MNQPAAKNDSTQGSERVEDADRPNRQFDIDRDPVEELADEFLERYRRGEYPSVTEYAEEYPEQSDQIRRLFPTVAALEGFKIRKEQRQSDGRVSLGAGKLERLGDFRIIRELGRGGMGIVYEAEQETLGRRVAVKVLPRQLLLDRKHLQRFQREAQLAAMLHHTNIVPVFGVGEHDGFHYYVMQLIHGIGLDEVLAIADSDLSFRLSGPGTKEQGNSRTLATTPLSAKAFAPTVDLQAADALVLDLPEPALLAEPFYSTEMILELPPSRANLLEAALECAVSTLHGRGLPVLAAWSDGPLHSATLDGDRSVKRGTTLLIAASREPA